MNIVSMEQPCTLQGMEKGYAYSLFIEDNIMEKISIVKRREKESAEPDDGSQALKNSYKKNIIVAFITAFLIGLGVGVVITNLVSVYWVKSSEESVLLKKSDETIRELQQIKSMISGLSSVTVGGAGGKIIDEKASIALPGKGGAAQEIKAGTSSVGGNKVYIHYGRDGDREMAEAFSQFLRNKGYASVETEKVRHSSRDIRYFHGGDKEAAVLLQKQLKDFIAGSQNAKKFAVKVKNLAAKYPRAQKGALEVWVVF
jgi:hypothetical protein